MFRFPVCHGSVLVICAFTLMTMLPWSWAPLSAQELTVYSARHYDADRQLYELFTETTGIQVRVVEDGGDQLMSRLRAEGRNSSADVFITVDAGRLAVAERRELFAPVESEYLIKRIPSHLRHPEGLWYAFGQRYRIIVYAKDRVDPAELSTYEDLVDPKWRGRILVRSSSNVYNQSLMASMIATHGSEAAEAWARGLAANFARQPQGGDRPQIRGVAAGEGDIAIVNHYYTLMMRDSDDPNDAAIWDQIGLFFPNQGEGERGAHTNVSGAGMLRYAPNPEHAQAFLEFLASDAGQEAWIRGSREFPVVEGITPPLSPDEYPFRADTSVSAQDLGRWGVPAMMLFDRAGWR
ncbi:MAG: extracellular solute-binding protein [Planctomycetota bacterium]|nr:MAG: extracellular solute-binding protein [Planctomycetota bacterium]